MVDAAGAVDTGQAAEALDVPEIELRARAYEARLRRAIQPEAPPDDHYRRPDELRFTKDQIPDTTVLFGGLTVAHEELVADAMRSLGFTVERLPVPDNAALALGKELGSRGQCNPTYYTVGNLIRHLKELREAGEEHIEDRYVFITAGGCGPCRFGMYEAEFRKSLREAGFEGFRVLLFEQRGGVRQGDTEDALKLNIAFGLAFLKGLMLGDLINELGYKIRPYELHAGDTDNAIEEARLILGEALREKRSVYRALRRVRKHFEAVEVDYTRLKPKVKITGEFWAQTTEGDGNYHMFRWLESEGAEVLVEPVGTWVEYLIWISKQEAEERVLVDGVRRQHIKLRLLKHAFRAWYDVYRHALGRKPDPLPDQDRLAAYAEQYYDTHLRGGEGHLEVGKTVMATKEQHAHMVISLKPFGCMPSTMSDGVQSRVVADYPDAIYLPIETSGDGEVNVRSRVQMKLYEAKMQARQELSEVLAEQSVTVEQVRAHTEQHREWRNPMRRYGEHHGISTAANFIATIGDKLR